MIEVKNLKFSYGKKQLFDNLNLSAKSGNIYGLLGKNGAGKTTLLSLLAGLLRPSGGDISIMDYVPRRRSPNFLNKVIYVPEKFYTPSITVKTYEEIYKVFYPDFDSVYFNNCLDEFGIEIDKRINTLSYGQQKKFLLAFAFASMCPLVLMDEPTNGLDIPSKKQFRKILVNAATEERLFIISTHQVRDLENLIDPIIILDEGKIIFNHTLEEVESSLAVYHSRDRKLAESSLYYEKSLKGYSVVMERNNEFGDEGRIELESLFNLVIENTEKVQSLFARKESENENK